MESLFTFNLLNQNLVEASLDENVGKYKGAYTAQTSGLVNLVFSCQTCLNKSFCLLIIL